MPAGSAAFAAAQVPFDLRLTPPEAPRNYPYTGFVNAAAEPAPGVDVLATYAIALEGGMATAVVLSLFTDARAGADDTLPAGQRDRRGWVGAEFLPPPDTAAAPEADDDWGSLLWLLTVGKATDDVPARAQFYAREALQWMLRDGLAGRIDVAAYWVRAEAGRQRLAIRPTIWRPDEIAPVYDVLWGTALTRWNEA